MIDHDRIDPADFQAAAGEASRLLKALSNEKRLMILCRLGEEELPVSVLVAASGLSQSALSQHLARLRDEGLVATRREAQSIFYRISDPAVLRVIAVLAALYCPPPDQKD